MIVFDASRLPIHKNHFHCIDSFCLICLMIQVNLYFSETTHSKTYANVESWNKLPYPPLVLWLKVRPLVQIVMIVRTFVKLIHISTRERRFSHYVREVLSLAGSSGSRGTVVHVTALRLESSGVPRGMGTKKNFLEIFGDTKYPYYPPSPKIYAWTRLTWSKGGGGVKLI